ncbi:DUF3558 domain-containing protein [Streptomyces sp. NPDC094448]|uniref:DUF3558 domain-containing protein n=1 Tax=Streptomyces sp. NPDC094448 TaxID=3366063 RepID=UPI00380F01B3
MRRRAYATGTTGISGITGRTAAAVGGLTALAALATGCTGEGTGTTGPVNSKAGTGTAVSAAPGKYRNLLEPCGSVGRSTLKDLLPGLTELPDEQQGKALRGTPMSTYDTDRKVGCSWEAKAPDSSRTFSLDFERVVSYASAVSDDDRAQKVFEGKQLAAGVALAEPGTSEGTGTGTGAPGGTGPQTASPPAAATATASTSASASTGTGGEQEAEEPPGRRILDDLGDAAFLDDVTSTPGAGSTAQRRTVSVVFRTSNVIVTVVYVEQSGVAAEPPDGKELQDKAQSVARSLVRKFGS